MMGGLVGRNRNIGAISSVPTFKNTEDSKDNASTQTI